jgi:hypothetical protein
MNGRFGGVSQRPVACLRGVLAHMPGQCAPRPHLCGITEIFRLGTGYMNYPGLGIFGDRRFSGPVVGVLQRRAGTYCQSLTHPLPDALTGHPDRTGNLRDRLTGIIAQHDSRPLRFPPRRRPRISQALEVFDLLGAQFQLGSLRPARHTMSVTLNIPIWICLNETLTRCRWKSSAHIRKRARYGRGFDPSAIRLDALRKAVEARLRLRD